MSTSQWSSSNNLTTKASYIPNSEEAILTANNAASYTYFAKAVAISGDGTRVAVSRTDNSGGVYIFAKVSGSWALETKINNPETNSQFGASLAMDATGTRLAAGAPNGDYSGYSDAGWITIFKRTGTSWSSEATLVMTSPWYSDRLGDSLTFDQDATRCIAGASTATYASATNTGKVVIFLRSGTNWSTEAVLTAGDYHGGDRFGFSVATDLTATRIIVGAHVADRSGLTDTGAAYIFTRSGTTWTQEAKLTNYTTAQYDQYGCSVSMSGDGTRVAIGARYSSAGAVSYTGKVFLYTRTGSSWSDDTTLVLNSPVDQDQFGSAVKFNSNADKLIVGASYKSTQSTTNRAGVVFIFTRSGSTWSQTATLNPSIPNTNMAFGINLDITADGTKLIIGATGADITYDDAGAAYIFS